MTPGEALGSSRGTSGCLRGEQGADASDRLSKKLLDAPARRWSRRLCICEQLWVRPEETHRSVDDSGLVSHAATVRGTRDSCLSRGSAYWRFTSARS